ncbi:alpha-ketoglutarate-dependent dioxygenase AlkB-like isoform X2 [Rhodamnia argentea]|nr:alpha-ketoglutarate-dependent dioxygenase AlkB-like isoform X2 [Rhodamnia argentea]
MELNLGMNRIQIEETENNSLSLNTNSDSLRSEPQQPSSSDSGKAKETKSIAGFENLVPAEDFKGTGRFDICVPQVGAPVMLKPSLLVKNREKRNEEKRSLEEPNWRILRPGMVLLKSYLSISDQVKIVKLCRDLGLGAGGFYQPGYKDGAKLHLKMMCLGKNWDPETSEYGVRRPIDGAKPPRIPEEFCYLVAKAISDSDALISKNIKKNDAQEKLPPMAPNICIVNFYTASGRLGLHQDRDESEESLRKGIPVVSFSIGDSAEFLYGDERDIKAEKVLLESGDVLIFGGKSRHIFHGVPSILQDSAPKALLEESRLRTGRLNLTFREY